MEALDGYQLHVNIRSGKKSIVYQGIRQHDKQPVVIKLPRRPQTSIKEKLRFKNEYRILAELDLPGIVKIHGFENYTNGIAIIEEDFGAIGLDLFLKMQPLQLPEFLNIAIQLAEALEQLHLHNIVHRDINPSNILINPKTHQVKITDFSLATLISQTPQEVKSPELLEGTLPYISPELTGRMNRDVDYRADLYSLGVSFYQMLTGRLPFQSQDPMELVHSHIAKSAVPPNQIDPAIPDVVSDMIMILLEKKAEERYQSPYGLKHDLALMLESLQCRGTVTSFALRQRDVSINFKISQKIYGRENEIRTLLETFERVSRGKSELMLVSGNSGIGKTALVLEIQKPVMEKYGFFITASFDRFHRNIPFRCFIQALRSLVKQLLTESQHTLAQWKQKFDQALEDKAQIIVDVIPELELIIGAPNPLPSLGPAESLHRFSTVFQKFVRVFAQKDHPLVLFLDNLQWADSASLNLIRYLSTDLKSRHLLIICAFRENEISAASPFIRMVDDIKNAGTPLNRLHLNPLNETALNHLVADTLLCSPDASLPLARRLMEKTGGNPFFSIQQLRVLNEQQAITLDAAEGCWRWHTESANDLDISDHVVSLMIWKIQKLPQKTQQILKLAACLGNHFDLHTLAKVNETSSQQTAEALWHAIQHGLITSYDNKDYQFLHDRIQQAAYFLIAPHDLAALHLKVGRLLAGDLQEEEYSFEIINHLNAGRRLIQDEKEKEELIRLNLFAAKKAKRSNAFGIALEYTKIGTQQLAEEDWRRRYPLCYELFLEKAICNKLTGNLKKAEYQFDFVLSQAQTILDKAKVRSELELLFLSQGRHREVIDSVLMTLSELGFDVPAHNNSEQIKKAAKTLKEKAFAEIGEHSVRELQNRPEATDPIALQAHKHLYHLAASAFSINIELYVWLGAQNLELAVRTGNTELASINYMVAGLSLLVQGELDLAYEFAQLGVRLSDKYQSIRMQTVCYFHFCLINGWKKHFSIDVEYAGKAAQLAIDSGDLLITVWWSAYAHVRGITLSGMPLADIVKHVERYIGLSDIVTYEGSGFILPPQRMALALQGKTVSHTSFDDHTGTFDEDNFVQKVSRYESPAILFNYYIYKLQTLYILEQHDTAYELAQEAEKFITPYYVQVTEFYFYYALILESIHPRLDDTDRAAALKTLDHNRQKLKAWADQNPENFKHRWLLVEAEYARITGDNWNAAALYDDAIASAAKNRFTQNQAIANECAAKFYAAHDKIKIARTYMTDAVIGYQKWGAVEKIKLLIENYPEWIQTAGDSASEVDEDEPEYSRTQKNLDFGSLAKASQAISSEIQLEYLLKKMVGVVIENAGAQNGLLLLEEKGQWNIKTRGFAENNTSDYMEARSYDSEPLLLCPSVVNYVLKTREPAVIEDATNNELFAKDPYVKQHRPKSILCFPILKQNRLTGILYLENNLFTGTFTQSRIEILRLLSVQMAISIENAKLYNDLRQANKFLTAEVAERKKAETALQKAHDKLELRVQERTEELYRAFEDLKQAKEAAEAATESKSRFLANMSHEIRTPMNAVMGLINLCLETRLTSKQRNYLQQSLFSAQSLLHIINDILDFSKIEAGKLDIESFEFNLDEMLSNIKSIMVPKAVEQGLTISFKPHVKLRKSYIGDPLRIGQVLNNLLSNAVKFTKTGTIKVTVGIVFTEENKSLLQFDVIDTGIGLSAEQINRLFSPFSQADESTTRMFGGTGLGLSICKKLTNMMGGDIWVYSQIGKGATFSFTVMLEHGRQRPAWPRKKRPDHMASQGVDLTGLRVLVAEDNHLNQLIIREALTKMGATVHMVADGLEAVQAAGQLPWDIILMDIQMPKMDGVEALGHIRANTGVKQCPVVALTANVMKHDIDEYLSKGFDMHIGKPIDFGKLFAGIDTLCRK